MNSLEMLSSHLKDTLLESSHFKEKIITFAAPNLNIEVRERWQTSLFIPVVSFFPIGRGVCDKAHKTITTQQNHQLVQWFQNMC